jgi:hypothetical protein
MLEKLKARDLGLEDPDPIKPPHWLDREDNQDKEKKATKKKVLIVIYIITFAI